MIKGFIFDLDNTLVDDDRGWQKALELTCEYIRDKFDRGHTMDEIYLVYKQVSDYIWNNYNTFLARFSNRQQKRQYVWMKTLEQLGCYQSTSQLKDVVKIFSKFRENTVFVYEYTYELLEKIKHEGFKIIICTDGEVAHQWMKCTKANIAGMVDQIISSTDLGMLKPDKGVFEKCIEYFGTEPDTLIFIGDDVVKDIKGARDAGMRTILVNGSSGVTLKNIYENIENILEQDNLDIINYAVTEADIIIKGKETKSSDRELNVTGRSQTIGYKDYKIDEHQKSRVVTWSEYQDKIERLASFTGISYDYVLGIFQGGYIIALSLGDYLYKSKIGGIISSTKDVHNKIILTDEKKMDINEIAGKKILLVDEVVESGYSIKKCKDILKIYNTESISTACIYWNSKSMEKIDYFVEIYNGDINFIFPWRINRDCVSLITDVMKPYKEYDEHTIAGLVINTFGVNLSEAVIKETLASREKIFSKKGNAWRKRHEG